MVLHWFSCRAVMAALAESKDWRPGWVFDGRKNLYAPSMFLPQHETCFEVNSACSSWPLLCTSLKFCRAGLTTALWTPFQDIIRF